MVTCLPFQSHVIKLTGLSFKSQTIDACEHMTCNNFIAVLSGDDALLTFQLLNYVNRAYIIIASSSGVAMPGLIRA